MDRNSHGDNYPWTRNAFKTSLIQSINRLKRRRLMLTTPKNKTELLAELKKEKDFIVQTVLNGPASTVSKEIAKMGTKLISVIIIPQK
jgi:hypothetical protein